jgi:hypothetical protein
MKHTMQLILLLALISGVTTAQEKQAKPNFSGAWVMNDPSEDNRKTATETPFMQVVHREPQLKVTIASSSRSAHQDVWALTTDGAENTNRMNGAEVNSKTHWDGDSLVTEWTIRDNGRVVQHRQVWSLSRDGRRLTMAMRDGNNETTVTAMKQ